MTNPTVGSNESWSIRPNHYPGKVYLASHRVKIISSYSLRRTILRNYRNVLFHHFPCCRTSWGSSVLCFCGLCSSLLSFSSFLSIFVYLSVASDEFHASLFLDPASLSLQVSQDQLHLISPQLKLSCLRCQRWSCLCYLRKKRRKIRHHRLSLSGWQPLYTLHPHIFCSFIYQCFLIINKKCLLVSLFEYIFSESMIIN